MRAFSLRSTLLPLYAALVLPVVACGDDATPGPDTSDTVQDTSDTTDTSDTVQDTSDTRDTVQPDTRDTVEPDTNDTVEPDTSDTVEPDTSDTVEPDTSDTLEPDTDDTAQPDTSDPDTSDATDTAQPDATDTTQPDTTQTSLATLVAPFAGSANNFETTPGATLTGLVVTLVKPDVGTELGGFFAIDPNDLTPVYFAPATGAAALPDGLAETSIIDVTISKMKNVSGMPMVTEYSGLTVTGAVESLDGSFKDASAWTSADWTDTQATYIDLEGKIVGASAASGGGGAWRRFGFTSTGLTAVDAQVNLRLPTEYINYYAIEDGCTFDLIGGAVWAFRGSAPTDVVQYQPMFVAPWSFLLFCTPPVLTQAATTSSTTVVLTFSRPMLAESFDVGSFTFEPPLEVQSFEFSTDLKSVTLTTAQHAASSYTVTIDPEVVDTTYEPINPDERSATFNTGAVQPVVAVLYCMEDATGATFVAEPTVVAAGFTAATAVTRVGGTNQDPPTGNASKPSQCPAAGTAKSISGSGFSTAAAFDASATAYYQFGFTAPAGRLKVVFDGYRSNTGPQAFAVWTSVTNGVIGTQTAVPTSPFTSYPMFPTAGEFAFDVPAADTVVTVRIYPYGGGAGTFRVDNLTVLFTPAN